MESRKLIFLGFIGIVAGIAGALMARSYFGSQSEPPVLRSGTALQPTQMIPTFALLDQDGQRFDNARLRGRWNLLFFGFTNCGDVCPTTLAMLANVDRNLADLTERQRPRVIFISVDARRDTPEVVKAYVRNFDPNFVGLTGSQNDLNALTQALGVPSAIRPLENGAYAVDHSAAILAVNPRGEFAALFTPPHKTEDLQHDYRALIGTE